MKIIGLYINITPSLPRGLYRAASGGIHRGDIIAFCLPPDLTLIGLEEHFILPGRTCPKSNALIKQVIAVPGDSITLTWQTIQVNSTIYPYPTQVSTSNHHPLETIPRGVYRATGYWVIGTHATNSWDSRYWGEVKPENILSKLKPILTETK